MDVRAGSSRLSPQRSPISSFMNGDTIRTIGTVNGLNQTLNGTTPDTHEVSNQRQANNTGNSITEKTYFFTGSAERVIAWNRVLKQRCFFEVIALLVSVQENQENMYSIILLKDKKGPILQVVHYFDHVMPEEEFMIGQPLRYNMAFSVEVTPAPSKS